MEALSPGCLPAGTALGSKGLCSHCIPEGKGQGEDSLQGGGGRGHRTGSPSSLPPNGRRCHLELRDQDPAPSHPVGGKEALPSPSFTPEQEGFLQTGCVLGRCQQGDKEGGFPCSNRVTSGDSEGRRGKGKSPVFLAHVPRRNSPVGDGQFPALLSDFHSWGLP